MRKTSTKICNKLYIKHTTQVQTERHIKDISVHQGNGLQPMISISMRQHQIG